MPHNVLTLGAYSFNGLRYQVTMGGSTMEAHTEDVQYEAAAHFTATRTVCTEPNPVTVWINQYLAPLP